MTLTLAQARSILDKTLAVARERKFKPLGVAVVDNRGALRAYADEDGSPIMRSKIASGKAFGAVAFGTGSRRLHQIGFVRAPDLVPEDQLLHIPDQLLAGSFRPQPLGHDPRAALRVQPFVDRIVQRVHGR